MVDRRFPRPRDLAPLLQFKKLELNAKKRRLAAALTIDDLRTIAKRRTPKPAFDYTRRLGRGGDFLRPSPAGVPGHPIQSVDPA